MQLKHTFFYVILLFLVKFTQAQPANINFTDAKGLKQGPWKKTNEIGQVLYEGAFVNGKPNGNFKYYYLGGQKKAESFYFENGTKVRTILFYETGEVKAKGNYINEKKDSVWIFYDEKGRLISETAYKNNQRNGLMKIYYPSGKIYEESEWVDDVKNGKNIQYYENGKTKAEGLMKEGYYDGRVTRYHDTGEKSAYGSYINKVQAGDWFYYDENGIPTFKETIKKGEPGNFKYYNGVFDEQYPSGMPKFSMSFKNGKKNGPFKIYYDKGEYKFYTKKTENTTEPEIVRELVGTQVNIQGNYVDDVYDGEIIFYTLDGKIDKVERYDKGVLINKTKK